MPLSSTIAAIGNAVSEADVDSVIAVVVGVTKALDADALPSLWCRSPFVAA